MEKPKIKIGVVSDIVCPWCYIGKRRLEKAMLQSSAFYDFEVAYFPFQLDPRIPEEGVDYQTYARNKFESDARFLELNRHLRDIAWQEGIDFHPERQKIFPNTRNAHRVILLAREDGKQWSIVEKLFAAYFSEGVDLSRIDKLVALATSAGMDGTRVEELLESNTGNLEIEMAEKELHDLGITAVPLFIIGNKVAISGAQPVDTFIKAFEEVCPSYKLHITSYS